MKLKKFLCLGAAVLMIGALTACAGEEETAATTETAVSVAPAADVAAPETQPVRDLGGRVITIASWADLNEPDEKKSAYEEALWEYRNEMMEKHNFKMEELAMSKWQDTLELFSTSTLAGEPAAEIFRFHATRTIAAVNSGLCYDLSTLDSIDPMDPKWNPPLAELMSVGDAQYGVAIPGRPKNMLFYNKRLFEEAGLDPDLPYDLQESGEWTWDTFMEISEKLTRDIDNDGVNDVYAMVMNSSGFAETVVMSNDGTYLGIDENGKYYNGLELPETIAALEWAADYWATDYDLAPSHWNGHEELFRTAQAAMYIAIEWSSTNLTQENMPDDWGLVSFPKGPNADGYRAMYKDPAYVIPNSYSKEEAEDIAFALDLWYGGVPGYGGEDQWKTELYPLYRDERGIEETNVIARVPENMRPDYTVALPSDFNAGLVATDVYHGKATVAESIEAYKNIWQIEVDKLNAKK